MNAQNGSTDVRTQIVTLALGLGFDLCRFARADAPEHATQFREWLDRWPGRGTELPRAQCRKAMRSAAGLAGSENGDSSRVQLFSGRARRAAVSAADSVAAGVSPANPPKIAADTAPLHPPVASRDMPGVMIIIS